MVIHPIRSLFIAAIVVVLACFGASQMPNFQGAAPPDPFILNDSNMVSGLPYRDTKGLTVRSQTIDPAKKTLVLIVAGQSLVTNITPTLYTPTNSSVIDNFNIYDGALYSINGPLLGTTTYLTIGPGNLSARIADLFVTNSKFDRLILLTIARGGTYISDHVTGSDAGRIAVAMRRLASRGITAATTGVTMAFLWAQGEADYVAGTTQANYAAAFTGAGGIVQQLTGAGFSGRIFINLETSPGDTTSGTRLAQASVVNGTTIFQGGDWNAIGVGSRVDGTHFNDTGAASGALSVYNAMVATGY